MATTTGTNVGSTQVNTVSSTSNTVNTVTLQETAILYMRAKTVTFSVQGLKPNTIYYPFFNDIDVSSYCSMVSGQQSSVLKTNATGDIKGSFYIPSNTFLCGSLKFKLVDNTTTVNGKLIADPLYGSAEAYYEANGTLKLQQTQVTTNTTINTSITISVAATVAPPVVECESWFFEYAVYSGGSYIFTLTTNSSTPVAAALAKPKAGSPLSANGSYWTATYLKTTQGTGNIWYHTYIYRTTYGHTVIPVNIYRQEWIGKTTDTRPSLTGWKPSGILSTDKVEITTPWTKISTIACPVNLGLGSTTVVKSTKVDPADPIAQSFFIDASKYPDGIFVTSIDVYFKTVDQSTPVSLELRDMSNGLPGTNIFPGGTVLIPGTRTAQSPDATISTTFRFDFPIYLKSNDEYCFVVRSSSLGYNMWCSKLGEADITTGSIIDSQPISGTLFLSENNYTWTPDQYQDIKYNMNIAVFDTTKTMNTVYKLQGDSSKYYGTKLNIPLSHFYTIKGTKNIQLYLPMHSLENNDKIYIEGIGIPSPSTAYNNIEASSLNGEFIITVIDEDYILFTTTGSYNATKSGYLNIENVSNIIDVAVYEEVPVNYLQTNVPVIINTDNYSSSTVPAEETLSFPTPPTITSTNSCSVYTNIQVNEAMIDYMATVFDDTSLSEYLVIASGVSSEGDEIPYIIDNFSINHENYQVFDTPRLVATPQNEALHNVTLAYNDGNIVSNNSAVVNIQGSSANKYISPVIDTNGMSINVRSYKIDNQAGELDVAIDATLISIGTVYIINSIGTTDFTTCGASSNTPGEAFKATAVPTGTGTVFPNSEIIPGAGRAAAKYKTVVRQMTDFHQRIQIFVDANCPAPAVIDAYIRVSADYDSHTDHDWQWVPLNGVYGTSFINSPDRTSITEWKYELTTATQWNVYDIKLVMRSSNNSIVPKIYSIRTITDVI